MTIEKAVEAKWELAHKIRELVLTFEKETLLSVAEVEVFHGSSMLVDSLSPFATGVNVVVNL